MLVKRWQSKGGKYSYELYRDEMGFTYKEFDRTRLIGGGSFGPKSEAEVLEYIARYIQFFPSTMREV